MNEVELIGLATGGGVSATDSGKRYEFAYASTEAAEVIQDESINTVVVLTATPSARWPGGGRTSCRQARLL